MPTHQLSSSPSSLSSFRECSACKGDNNLSCCIIMYCYPISGMHLRTVLITACYTPSPDQPNLHMITHMIPHRSLLSQPHIIPTIHPSPLSTSLLPQPPTMPSQDDRHPRPLTFPSLKLPRIKTLTSALQKTSVTTPSTLTELRSYLYILQSLVQKIRPDIEIWTASDGNAESDEELRARVDSELALNIGTNHYANQNAPQPQPPQDLPSSPPASNAPPRPKQKRPRSFFPSSQPSSPSSSPPFRNATPEEERQVDDLLGQDEWTRQMMLVLRTEVWSLGVVRVFVMIMATRVNL
jgi:hypothetical protein